PVAGYRRGAGHDGFDDDLPHGGGPVLGLVTQGDACVEYRRQTETRRHTRDGLVIPSNEQGVTIMSDEQPTLEAHAPAEPPVPPPETAPATKPEDAKAPPEAPLPAPPEASESEPAPETKPEEPAAPSNKKWYVVKVQSGREESIKEAIERRVKIEGLEE